MHWSATRALHTETRGVPQATLSDAPAPMTNSGSMRSGGSVHSEDAQELLRRSLTDGAAALACALGSWLPGQHKRRWLPAWRAHERMRDAHGTIILYL